jgi:hypothetical protein
VNQKHTFLDEETSSQIIDKIMEDWGSLFIGVTFLHHDLQVMADIDENGKRCVRSISYCIYDDDSLSGLPIPETLHKEIIDWSLHWGIDSDWNDPSDFSMSDYDAEGIKYLDVDWDDPNLPQQVFEEVVDQIDWWAVGERLYELGTEGRKIAQNAPIRIQTYLENSIALGRRQVLGRWRYLLYLTTNPSFTFRRLAKRGLWLKLTAEQGHAFSFHWSKT